MKKVVFLLFVIASFATTSLAQNQKADSVFQVGRVPKTTGLNGLVLVGLGERPGHWYNDLGDGVYARNLEEGTYYFLPAPPNSEGFRTVVFYQKPGNHIGKTTVGFLYEESNHVNVMAFSARNLKQPNTHKDNVLGVVARK